MAEIDQLSQIIGSLDADTKETRRQLAAQFRKLDGIEEKITELAGAVRLLAEGHSDLKKTVNEDIKPVVSDYKDMKNRGLGVIALVGVFASGVGAGLFKLIYGANG